LLAQAGWQDLNGDRVIEAHGVPGVPDNTKFQLTMNTYDGWEALADAQKLIVQMLREVGIRVTSELAGQQDLWATGRWRAGGSRPVRRRLCGTMATPAPTLPTISSGAMRRGPSPVWRTAGKGVT